MISRKKYFVLACSLLCLITGVANAQEKVLLNFNDTNGANPHYTNLTYASGVLYGMTTNGGNNVGLIFSIDTNGSNYKDLGLGNDGSSPIGSLTLSGNTLYGMTTNGGRNSDGNIFSIATNGSNYKSLFSFNVANGQQPYGSLTFSGKKLYGMVAHGGANSDGVIFSVDSDGSNYKVLLNFNGTNGNEPDGSLTLSGNILYGMTNGGGIHGAGNVFSIDTNGSNYIDLFDFNGADGNQPYGNLTLSGNTLYGMTSGGGVNSDGNIFSIDTNGNNYTDLFDFNGTNGRAPLGSLTLSGNTFYGMTAGGGANNDGVIFSMDTNGSNYKDLLDFNGTNGKGPQGSLILWGNQLYGMTTNGGKYNSGLVFSMHFPLNISPNSIPLSCNGGNNGQAIANASGGTPPYTYKWSPGGSTKDTVNGLSAGTYSVTITDHTNSTQTASVIVAQPMIISVTKDSTNVTGAGCNGAASVNVSGGTAPYSYKWSPGGGTNDTINGKCVGQYCCTITDNNGCKENVCITLVNATGIHNIMPNAEQITLFPKPSNGIFTIQAHSQQSAEADCIEIYNMLGEKVLLETLRSTQSDNTINLSNQPNGIYFYRVLQQDGTLLGEGKVVIAH